MKDKLYAFLIGCVVSLYIYPIGFTFLPENINSKMIFAVIGAVCFIFDCVSKHEFRISRVTFSLFCIAAVFSLVCYWSVTVNDTNDMSYVKYVISFLVWMFSAYFVCRMIRKKNGYVDMMTITVYLTWVAVVQCMSALIIDNVPSVASVVDKVMFIGQDFCRDVKRLYGLGAGLDSAGVRFSVTLILLSWYLCKVVIPKGDMSDFTVYFIAFVFIVVAGNMISRTTTVGALIGLVLVVVFLFSDRLTNVAASKLRARLVIVTILMVSVPFLIYRYNSDSSFQDSMRFAFEGFFNWIETGTWSTGSTDKLNATMWKWPARTKSWVIGTGMFDNYAFGTDIGYCRLILYCGIIGFGIFSFFFVYNAYELSCKFPDAGILAFLLLVMTFIVWIKVATDIFFIYALLICADAPPENNPV